MRCEGYDAELILIPHDPFVIIFIFHTKESAEDGAQTLHLFADIKMTKPLLVNYCECLYIIIEKLCDDLYVIVLPI